MKREALYLWNGMCHLHERRLCVLYSGFSCH